MSDFERKSEERKAKELTSEIPTLCTAHPGLVRPEKESLKLRKVFFFFYLNNFPIPNIVFLAHIKFNFLPNKTLIFPNALCIDLISLY